MAKGNGELPPQKPIPVGESAFSLVERDLPDPKRLCEPWATEGVTLLAGRPKLGKTTFERQKLAAAATGAQFLDSKFSNPSLCAFLSLEEGETLTRLKLRQANFSEAALTNIQLHFEWARGWEAADMLDKYLAANPDLEFIVIDSLSRFRAVPDARQSQFSADYEAMTFIHECSKKHPGVCIDVIHHTRKGKSDDPIDDVSGTYGLTAACDTVVVLRNHTEGASMYVAGRIWARDDNNFVLKREGGKWIMLGVNLELPDEQLETLAIIKARPDGIGGQELGDKLAITRQSAWQRIDILVEKGFVVKRFNRAYIKGTVS